jgi:hypothetical protein
MNTERKQHSGILELACLNGTTIKLYNGSDFVPGEIDKKGCPALQGVSRVRGYVRDNGAVLASLTSIENELNAAPVVKEPA